MTELLFLAALVLGAGIVWLVAVMIDAREYHKRADALGAALTPTETSGYDVDTYYASEQDHPDD